jgi:hypothetical protein
MLEATCIREFTTLGAQSIIMTIRVQIRRAWVQLGGKETLTETNDAPALSPSV